MCRSLQTMNFVVLIHAVAAMPLWGQPVFSIDFQGPTIGLIDPISGASITEGDLLVVSPDGWPTPGPVSRPRIVVTAGPGGGLPNLGLSTYGGAVGHAPGVAGLVEIDALSFGTDFLLQPDPPFAGVWVFSVDEFAVGLSHAITVPPNVTTEGALGAMGASGDVFGGFGPGMFPTGPLSMFPPSVPPPGAAVLIDASGTAPPGMPHPYLNALLGLGLVEPNAPTPAPGPPLSLPDPGDNLDALDIDTPLIGGLPPFPIYVSLDSVFADPLESPPPMGMGPVNGGSAAALGFVGGDVLMVPASGAAPVLYASANDLGLDYQGGPDSDDLDALILWENGVPGFQPSVDAVPPYDWGPGGADMLLFSVRRGSAIIGIYDTVFNLPIEEGDILVPPYGGGPGFPGIFIPAENLGLGTLRTSGLVHADDLDALDVAADCNANTVPDRLEIALGQTDDVNSNGVPDACETTCGDEKCAPLESPCTCPADCGAPAVGETPGATCADGLDNDCDGPMDCTDPDCNSEPACTCGNQSCGAGEDPCNCPADCGPPPATETPGATCADGLDNDCDGPMDCADPDCDADSNCACGNETCGTEEDPCNCPTDCGPPPATETPGATCADGLDNDCDGKADCLDLDCADEPACGCESVLKCEDANACTCNRCAMGTCTFTAVHFGDVDCMADTVDVGDILCAVDGFGAFEACPNADISPNCTGDSKIDVGDILAVVDAFAGIDPCNCPDP